MFNLTHYITRENLEFFCKKHHIKKMALFGSALRDELQPDSDVDLLVEFETEFMPGLFDVARMEIELSKVFGRKVDLRTPEDLSRYFRSEVLDTAEVQYETA